MPSLSRTHTLYISSKHREEGTPSRYSVVIPQPMIEGDSNSEIIKISLVDFSCYYSWYLVNEGFNTITFKNLVTNQETVVSLPIGTYKYQRLGQQIAALYPACTVVWDEASNKLRFTFAQSHRMTFDGVYEVLGFSAGAAPTGTTIESERAMTPMALTHLYLNLANVSPVHHSVNLDNLSGEIRVSSVLARIPVNAPPFQLVHFINPTLESNGIDTNEINMNKLEFVITNGDGHEITFMPDHQMTLRIQVYDKDDADKRDVVENVREIRETLKDLFVMKHLRQNKRFS